MAKAETVQNILITGGTGLVGTRLSEMLENNGYTVSHLSRNPTNGRFTSFKWDVKNGEIDRQAIEHADAIIHLAGEGVADKRWSQQRKDEIYTSRIDSTKLLFESVKKHNPDLKYFVSASAIGYYGFNTGNELVDEESDRGEGFLADVVVDWEKASEAFDELKILKSNIRVGIVLSEKAGALVEMAKPVKLGFGAALGSGEQYMSWIHIEDLCGIFKYAMENSLTGIYNGVAPAPVINKIFTQNLAKTMKKPFWLPNVPKLALKLMLGEMEAMLTGGNRVSSKKIEESGFNFQFPSLDSALNDLIEANAK